MCGFLKARLSLVIVRSNSLLLCSPQHKAACFWQRPELTVGAVMALGFNRGELDRENGIEGGQVDGKSLLYSKGSVGVGV